MVTLNYLFRKSNSSQGILTPKKSTSSEKIASRKKCLFQKKYVNPRNNHLF